MAESWLSAFLPAAEPTPAERVAAELAEIEAQAAQRGKKKKKKGRESEVAKRKKSPVQRILAEDGKKQKLKRSTRTHTKEEKAADTMLGEVDGHLTSITSVLAKKKRTSKRVEKNKPQNGESLLPSPPPVLQPPSPMLSQLKVSDQDAAVAAASQSASRSPSASTPSQQATASSALLQWLGLENLRKAAVEPAATLELPRDPDVQAARSSPTVPPIAPEPARSFSLNGEEDSILIPSPPSDVAFIPPPPPTYLLRGNAPETATASEKTAVMQADAALRMASLATGSAEGSSSPKKPSSGSSSSVERITSTEGTSPTSPVLAAAASVSLATQPSLAPKKKSLLQKRIKKPQQEHTSSVESAWTQLKAFILNNLGNTAWWRQRQKSKAAADAASALLTPLDDQSPAIPLDEFLKGGVGVLSSSGSSVRSPPPSRSYHAKVPENYSFALEDDNTSLRICRKRSSESLQSRFIAPSNGPSG